MSREYERRIEVAAITEIPRNDVLFDDFEATLVKWITGKINASGSATRITTDAHGGEACMELKTGDTAPAIDDDTAIYRTLPTSQERYLKMSAIIRLPDVTIQDLYITLTFYFIWGIKFQQASLRLKWVGASIYLQVLNDSNTYETIPDDNVEIYKNTWFSVELIIDKHTARYSQVKIGGAVFDPSAILTYNPSLGYPRANQTIIVSVATRVATEKSMKVDNIIMRPTDLPT